MRASEHWKPRLPKPLQGWIARPLGLPHALRTWLTWRGSLTRRLKTRCSDFRVVPVATGFTKANRDEHAPLQLRAGSVAYVREVLLSCNQHHLVFAHSVLPRAGLRSGWNGITRLGTRPLGEALFNNPRIKREAMVYLRIDSRHPLFGATTLRHPLHVRALWARRSVFRLNGHPLLVTEVFFPGIERR